MLEISDIVHKEICHSGICETYEKCSKFANISREILQSYISICCACMRKNIKKGNKNSVVNPIA